jgi:preprotein translocase subunit SecD
MKARILTVPILLAVAVITSGCWMLFGVPNMGDPSSPTPTPVIVTPPPTQAANGSCWGGEYRFAPKGGQKLTDSLRAQVGEIEDNRLNSLGIVGIKRTATSRGFLVVVPGNPDREQVRTLVGATGKLDFVPVPPAFADQVTEGAPLPVGMPATPMFSGDQIASARPATDLTGLPAVDIELKPDGARIFDEFAAANYNAPTGGVKFAIVVDGIVQSALGVNTDHFGGSAQIVGKFSAEQVDGLVTVLTFGRLPVEVLEVNVADVSCAAGA